MEPILIVLLIGAFGGLVRSFIGYRRTPDDISFDYLKFGQTIAIQIILGAFVVFGATAVSGGEINLSHYIMAFFIAIDAQSLMKGSGRSDVTK